MNLTVPDTAAPAKSDAQLLDRVLVTAFLDHVPDHIYFKDRASRFIAVSHSKARALGVAPDDLIGKSDFDTFTEEHARTAFEDEQEIMRTSAPMMGKLEKETWPDGHVSWVLTSKMPLRDGQGVIIGTFGISKDVTQAQEMKASLEKSQRELIDASRLAGMAEIATGVLHNVGNVLNSLNVSANVIATGLRDSKAESLARIGGLLHAHSADLGGFLTHDPKGQLVPAFIDSLARHLIEDRARLLKELDSLQRNVDHIKEIVAMQQSHATMVGVVETLEVPALMEDALRMNAAALGRHSVRVVREFTAVPCIVAERGKVLQILVNLIRNAKYACDGATVADKVITLRLAPGPAGRVRLIVEDNGTGITTDNLTRIFQHGFTTKSTGHGFGLHSSANAAREMHGSLEVGSDGPGRGATFTLELPAAPVPGVR